MPGGLYLCPYHLKEGESLTSVRKYKDVSYGETAEALGWTVSFSHGADYGYVRIGII